MQSLVALAILVPIQDPWADFDQRISQLSPNPGELASACFLVQGSPQAVYGVRFVYDTVEQCKIEERLAQGLQSGLMSKAPSWVPRLREIVRQTYVERGGHLRFVRSEGTSSVFSPASGGPAPGLMTFEIEKMPPAWRAFPSSAPEDRSILMATEYWTRMISTATFDPAPTTGSDSVDKNLARQSQSAMIADARAGLGRPQCVR